MTKFITAFILVLTMALQWVGEEGNIMFSISPVNPCFAMEHVEGPVSFGSCFGGNDLTPLLSTNKGRSH